MRGYRRWLALRACMAAAVCLLRLMPTAAPVSQPMLSLHHAPRRHLQRDNVDLCGDSCEKIATRGNKKLDDRIRREVNCRSTWGDGCATAAPPRGFTATSTLWDLCPHACPADIRASDNSAGSRSPPSPTPMETGPARAVTPPPPSRPAAQPSPSPAAAASRPRQSPVPTAALLPPAAGEGGPHQERLAPKRGPDPAVLRAEIRTKLLGAAYDFLCAVTVALLGVLGGVFYCRRRKRQMKRMGMTSSNIGRKRPGGPRPPPWPPGRPGIAQGLSKLQSDVRRRREIKIAEEVPLYSIAEDYGSSDDDDDGYAPALNVNAVNGSSDRGDGARYGHVPTVVVTDRAQALAGMV